MAFAATHTVPEGGMPAWGAPDPSQQPTANLQANVELKLLEQRGDWAQVEAVNGWTGWVDARRLVAASSGAAQPQTPQPQTPQPQAQPAPAPETPAPQPEGQPAPAPQPATTAPQPQTSQPQAEPAPATAAQPQAAPAPSGPSVGDRVGEFFKEAPVPSGEARHWGIVGAGLVIVSGFLDWFRAFDLSSGGSASGWDAPLKFLIDNEAGAQGVSIGLTFLLIGGVALWKNQDARTVVVWRIVGVLSLLTVLLFIVQTQSLASDFGEGWFLDFLGAGPYVAIIGGLALILAPTRPSDGSDAAGDGEASTPGD